ncbi:MAG: hypothetical protein PHR63_00750 [Methanoregulaceae archaeon]|nr:hypothetical protein [Methanoregulaceae archaeon]
MNQGIFTSGSSLMVAAGGGSFAGSLHVKTQDLSLKTRRLHIRVSFM